MNDSLRELLHSVELLDIHMDGFVARTDNRALIKSGEGLQLLGRRARDEIKTQPATGDTPARIEVRYAMGLMVTGPGQEGNEEPIRAGVIECHLVAIYTVNGSLPDMQTIEAFADTSVLFNLWPYWREFVQESSQRLQWPTIRLPLFKFTNPVTPTPSRSKSASSATPKPATRARKRPPVE
ncbi:MAG: hypothetical protein HQL97_08880 [Magnetococcales bacterium]|nr:hypothetical protein [Magnetococcales bacterium]